MPFQLSTAYSIRILVEQSDGKVHSSNIELEGKLQAIYVNGLCFGGDMTLQTNRGKAKMVITHIIDNLSDDNVSLLLPMLEVFKKVLQ